MPTLTWRRLVQILWQGAFLAVMAAVSLWISHVILYGAPRREQSSADASYQTYQRTWVATSHLPPGATNVRSVGNAWYTFDMDVGGRVRHFLCCYTSETVTPTITELRD